MIRKRLFHQAGASLPSLLNFWVVSTQVAEEFCGTEKIAHYFMIFWLVLIKYLDVFSCGQAQLPYTLWLFKSSLLRTVCLGARLCQYLSSVTVKSFFALQTSLRPPNTHPGKYDHLIHSLELSCITCPSSLQHLRLQKEWVVCLNSHPLKFLAHRKIESVINCKFW